MNSFDIKMGCFKVNSTLFGVNYTLMHYKHHEHHDHTFNNILKST